MLHGNHAASESRPNSCSSARLHRVVGHVCPFISRCTKCNLRRCRSPTSFQVIFEGIVVTIVSLVLYGRAVVILGASGGSAFGALVPALSALLAIPLLGEWPNSIDWVGIVLISAGAYLASGARMEVDHNGFTLRRATACDAEAIVNVYSASFRLLTFLPICTPLKRTGGLLAT